MIAAAQVALGFHGWFTIGLVFVMFALMALTSIPVDMVFLGGSVLLLLSGALSLADVLSGFSAPVVATVGALFFVTAGLESTGTFALVMKHFLGVPKSRVRALLRLVLPVSALSAFMSNTLVVSIFTPIVKGWSRKLGIAPSKLLIPLSYAATMGGMCLLIGTPGNLVISEFYRSATGESLNICMPLVPGLCVVALGAAVMAVMGNLLPTRRTREDAFASAVPTSELKVGRSNHLVGLTIGEAGVPLDEDGCRLAGIVSFDGEMNARPTADTFLMGGDTLFYLGDKRRVSELARRCDFAMPEALIDDGVGVGARTYVAIVIFGALVALSAFGVMPLAVCCLGAALLMVLTRCCVITTAKKAVNWDLLMVLAGSVVMGKAVDRTGIAEMAAQLLIGWCGSNPMVSLTALCVIASLLTEFLTNVACGAILTPIALKIAAGSGLSPLPFLAGLMVSCSASFMTPIGSLTHLIVYASGGYKFHDFLRLGIVMNVIALIVAVLVVPLAFPFNP